MSHDLSQVRIGPYLPGDEHEIVRVFNKVFSQNRSMATWEWEYARNPAGIHAFLAKFPDGRVLSQFCGIPRVMRVGAGTACFGEIVDSMTDPDYRMGLKKPGLFASTCFEFVEFFGRPDREVIMYGLPNPMAFRVGQRLLGYVHLYDVELMTHEVAGALAPEGVTVAAAYPDDWDAFEQRIAVQHGIMTRRDRVYLDWRYLQRPDAHYELLFLRDASGTLFAHAALRHAWLGQPTTACGELMVDRDHPLAMSAAEAVRAAAARAGSTRVQTFVRPNSPEWIGLASVGWHPEPTQFRFVARTYSGTDLPLDLLKDNWSVSLGDFDIV